MEPPFLIDYTIANAIHDAAYRLQTTVRKLFYLSANLTVYGIGIAVRIYVRKYKYSTIVVLAIARAAAGTSSSTIVDRIVSVRVDCIAYDWLDTQRTQPIANSGTNCASIRDPGQISDIRDCPGDSGTVGAYALSRVATRLIATRFEPANNWPTGALVNSLYLIVQ